MGLDLVLDDEGLAANCLSHAFGLLASLISLYAARYEHHLENSCCLKCYVIPACK